MLLESKNAENLEPLDNVENCSQKVENLASKYVKNQHLELKQPYPICLQIMFSSHLL